MCSCLTAAAHVEWQFAENVRSVLFAITHRSNIIIQQMSASLSNILICAWIQSRNGEIITIAKFKALIKRVYMAPGIAKLSITNDAMAPGVARSSVQCLPFYIINEVGHLTTSVDHLAEFCENYHLAAICTQLMVKFFLQLRFIQYFDCKCMKIPDFSRIDSHFVA